MISFYKDIWKKKSTKDIMLSLISLIKKTTNSVKESSIKVFMNFTGRLNLIQYKIIESITIDNNNYDTYKAVCSNRMDLQNGACNQSLGLGSSYFISNVYIPFFQNHKPS